MSQDQQSPARSFKEFFERVPPGTRAAVENLVSVRTSSMGIKSYALNLPAVLELHCDTESCNGARLFEPSDGGYISPDGLNLVFVVFRCRNCAKSLKIYALWAPWKSGEASASVEKLGELPPFGPPTPARLISLVGPEKEALPAF
jgi:hypothetical protein